MGARTAMVDVLTASLGPRVKVVPDARVVDTIGGKVDAVVQVVVTSIRLAPTEGQVIADFELYDVVPFQDPSDGEEPLEAALDALLDVLLPLPWFAFEKAERFVYRDTWLAYKVTGYSQLTVEE